MSLLERIFYFHKEVLAKTYPNSRTVAREFEVSVATAKRDINYLRDRLLAPLSYDSRQNGYYYREEGFNLPFENSPKIVFLLAMLNKLAEEAGLKKLPEVGLLENRLATMLSPDYETLIDSLHCEWIEVESIDHRIFTSIIEAVVRKKIICLEYRSSRGKISSRNVAPRQIINYQGRWYLRAFCYLRKDTRLFHIGRINSAKLTENTIPPGTGEPDQLSRSFGIFKGEPRYLAKILFTSTAAELVRNQYWHKDQRMLTVREGVELQLPVSDDREIVMKILQYGAMARPLSPPELVERVQNEIASMTKLYTTEEES